jgi:hypothetical protein
LFSPAQQSELNRMLRWWRRHERDAGGAGFPAGGIVPFEFRRFELKGELRPGANGVQAYAVNWTDGAYESDEDTIFTVWDYTEGRRARGRDSMAAGQQGAWGWAVKPHDGANQPAGSDLNTGDAWEIVEVQSLALLCKANFKLTDWTTVNTIEPQGGGQSPTNGVSDDLTIVNPFSFISVSAGLCLIVRKSDSSSDTWTLIQAECP